MKVYLRWITEIYFGDIDAKTPEEAIKIAEDIVANQRNLAEDEISASYEVEDKNGHVIYCEKA